MTGPRDHRPPRWAERLLKRSIPGGAAGRSILGDMREEYGRRAMDGVPAARWWYRREAVGIALYRVRDGVFDNWRSPGRTSRPPRQRGDAMIAQVLRDLRYAVRTLRRSPGFTVVAAMTLAIGIGANSAVFSLVNGVLLQPLPFPQAERLVGVFSSAPGLDYPQFGLSPGVFFQYKHESDVFEDAALFRVAQGNLTGDGAPERVNVMTASASLFSTLRVTPTLGRPYLAEEDVPGAASLVVVSERLWRQRYGGDPALVGRTLVLDGVAREVVGVMPASDWQTPPPDLWIPLGIDPEQASPGNFTFSSIARLAPGASIESAVPQLGPLVDRLAERFAGQGQFVNFLNAGRYTPLLEPLKETVVGNLQRPLWILLGTVGFVLLIACANVANLFLVRAEGRRREMAVRTALGAARGVLVRQYLAETAVLAGLGGALGLALAAFGVPLLVRYAPDGLPRTEAIGLTAPVLGFTLIATAGAALLFGLFPAIRQTSSGALNGVIQQGRGNTAGRQRQLVRNSLVAAQTAAALILLVGSGLLVRSFQRIRDLDPGFSPGGVLTFQISLPPQSYSDALEVAGFHQRLLEGLSGLPGVSSVGAVQNIPLRSEAGGTAFQLEDFPTEQGELPPMLWNTIAAPGYFETMQIPLKRGRTFLPADHETDFGNVIVSEGLAARFWGDDDPIGRRIRFASDSAWYSIVGVVGDVRDRGLREDPSETVYFPMAGAIPSRNLLVASSMGFTVRSSAPLSIARSVREQVRRLDPNLPIIGLRTMDEIVGDSVARLSFTMLALATAAGLALILGAVGLYGVLSYIVSQRRQEIGVRIALGAEPARVQRMVVRQGLRIAGIGMLVGLIGAGLLARLLQGIMYGVEALDPVTYASTTGVLVVVGWMASFLPARRAAAVDPIESLNVE